MTKKEIFEITNSNSVSSNIMEEVVQDLVRDNPEIDYTRINQDEDPELVNMLLKSQAPTITPFFIGFSNGKVTGGISGIVSKQDLLNIVDA